MHRDIIEFSDEILVVSHVRLHRMALAKCQCSTFAVEFIGPVASAVCFFSVSFKWPKRHFYTSNFLFATPVVLCALAESGCSTIKTSINKNSRMKKRKTTAVKWKTKIIFRNAFSLFLSLPPFVSPRLQFTHPFILIFN